MKHLPINKSIQHIKPETRNCRNVDSRTSYIKCLRNFWDKNNRSVQNPVQIVMRYKPKESSKTRLRRRVLHYLRNAMPTARGLNPISFVFEPTVHSEIVGKPTIKYPTSIQDIISGHHRRSPVHARTARGLHHQRKRRKASTTKILKPNFDSWIWP